jgi:hypothetical protein
MEGSPGPEQMLMHGDSCVVREQQDKQELQKQNIPESKGNIEIEHGWTPL